MSTGTALRWTFMLLGALAIAMSALWYLQERKLLWDLGVYANAARLFLAGQDAYLEAGKLRFVYPPAILYLMAGLGPLLKPVFILLYLAALTLLLRRDMRLFSTGLLVFSGISIDPGQWFIPYGNAFVTSVATGNMTVFAHVLLIWLILARWPAAPSPAFWLAVLAVSLFKPYFLSYVAVPLLARPWSRRTFLRACAVVAASIALLLLQLLAMPEKFSGFLASLSSQVFENDASFLSGDLGFGLYRFAADATGSPGAALAIHGAAIAGLVALFLLAVKGKGGDCPNDLQKVLLAICIAILMNPRLKIYDAAALQAAAVAVILLTSSARVQVAALLALFAAIQVIQLDAFGALTGLSRRAAWQLAIGHLPWIVAALAVAMDRRSGSRRRDDAAAARPGPDLPP